MSFARASAVRGALRFGRTARPIAPRPQAWRQVARRGYASGHGSAEASSDLPWAIGAIVITVPTCYWLYTNKPEAAHHDDHHDSHHEEHDSEEEEESKDEEESTEEKSGEDEEKSDDGEEKSDDKEEDKSDDSGDDEGKDTPESSDDESDKSDETVESAEEGDGNNTVKRIPDAKGGNKKRLESNNAKTQGKEEETVDSKNEDKAASSKEAGGRHTQSGKQEGLSNTDTKHSYDIQNDPSKSKKGEGAPETAKSKGTVDVNRPQPEKE